MTDPSTFHAIRHRSLAAAGLGRSGVGATLMGDTLVLRGAADQQLIVPVATINRLRFGYEENRYAGDLYRISSGPAKPPTR